MSKILFLFISFLQIGLFSIGGGYATIPLIQQQVVEQNKFLTLQEFTDIITISQMTPGPLAVNTSTFVGIKIAGLSGAFVATFGCIISGFIISILLYNFFQKNKNSQTISFVLNGLKAASVGLIAASAATILSITLSMPDNGSGEFLKAVPIKALFLVLLCLFLLKKFKTNPMLIMILSGILGILFY